MDVETFTYVSQKYLSSENSSGSVIISKDVSRETKVIFDYSTSSAIEFQVISNAGVAYGPSSPEYFCQTDFKTCIFSFDNATVTFVERWAKLSIKFFTGGDLAILLHFRGRDSHGFGCCGGKGSGRCDPNRSGYSLGLSLNRQHWSWHPRLSNYPRHSGSRYDNQR
jgi:hypothetical protein